MRHAVGTSVKGLVMLASICQSTVLHTFRLWSSAWEAMYLPTGSHVRPLTSPVWPRKHVTISVEKKEERNYQYGWRASYQRSSTVIIKGVARGPNLAHETVRTRPAISYWPGNFRAFQMTIVLSTLQEASHMSWGDQATSITSKHTHVHI